MQQIIFVVLFVLSKHIPCVVFLDFGGGGDWSPSFSSDGDECFFDDK